MALLYPSQAPLSNSPRCNKSSRIRTNIEDGVRWRVKAGSRASGIETWLQKPPDFGMQQQQQQPRPPSWRGPRPSKCSLRFAVEGPNSNPQGRSLHKHDSQTHPPFKAPNRSEPGLWAPTTRKPGLLDLELGFPNRHRLAGWDTLPPPPKQGPGNA